MVTLSPDQSRAYIANIGSDNVTVIDVGIFEETERFETEIHPDGIVYLERSDG